MRIAKPNPHPTQTAAPIHHLAGEPLADILAALPPLLAHAPPEWHRARQQKISQQIAAYRPVTALQARLAGHIVLFRHLAATELAWARLKTNSPETARRRGRGAAQLLREADRLLHHLHQQQKRPLPPADSQTTTAAPPPPTNPLRRNPLHPEPARHHAPAPQAARSARPARAAKPPRPATPPTGPAA